jgi:septum site-determining protein MinD
MLAIAGGKGGCGKTTTALGLARAMARVGENPLVVDADTDCPDVHLLANVDREPTWDALDERVLDCVAQRSPSLGGIAVVPAGGADAVADALARVRDWPGPVLVDCPAGAGPAATTPLRAAERSVLATTDDPETLADTAKTADVAARLDARPAAAVVRTGESDLDPPFDAPVVETVPRVAIDRPSTRAIEAILSHPGVIATYQSVASRLGREHPPVRGR